ncbi:MAG: NAD(+) synthase, partial [Clostridia bacterium]|nr:NAD(+) synthase [Clostridia bacterium]
PLSRLTATEVRAIGRELGLPSRFVDKVPTDGLCGKTDEDNLGFSYDTLDAYIREGTLPPPAIRERIDSMYRASRFKLELMPCFEYTPDE